MSETEISGATTGAPTSAVLERGRGSRGETPRAGRSVRAAGVAGASPSQLKVLWAGLSAMLLSLPLALLIHVVNERLGDNLEAVLLVVGALFGLSLAAALGAYALLRRRSAEPSSLGLLILTAAGIMLMSTYLYWVSFYVRFPADLLMFAESDFVNDILKFRLGYPIYSPHENNESLNYTPGAPVFTYLLAWLSGNATSIPVYRAIQVGYTLTASVLALLCCHTLVAVSLSGRAPRNQLLWGAVWLPVLFLIATNSLTNPFVFNLHNDALAQLMAVFSYWLLLRYAATGDKRLLPFMAMTPALGFLAKQSQAIWAAFYCAHLLFFDRTRSLTRVAGFAAASFGAVGLAAAAGYLLWRDDFVYWVFYVLLKHTVSPIRAFDHALQVWVYYALGLLGGLILLRGSSLRILLGPWLTWLGLISAVTWTSGIDGLLNHIGAGSLIAGVWFLAGVTRLWSVGLGAVSGIESRSRWLHAGMGVALLLFLLAGLGVAKVPIKPFGDAPYEYARAIEREFEGQPASEVLLDMGTWVYVTDGVIMKDRAMPVTERGYSETGDFSGILRRLQEKRYSKILVHDLDKPWFWYEYEKWRTPSGIKRAMLDNYEEVGRIPAVSENRPGWLVTQGFGEISILRRKAD